MSGDGVHVVQFPHPGGEHGPDEEGGTRRRWQDGSAPHRRVFMLGHGTWRRGAGGPAPARRGDVTLWGEWEADSAVGPAPSPVPGGPRWLHRPLFLGAVAAPAGVPQNTDPFVFGERFLYTFCRQSRNAALRGLGRGSVVLFGSALDGHFVLDTVLVVAGLLRHGREDYATVAAPRTDPVFRATTLDPMYAWERTARGTLYFGATPADPVAGMFSFAPCLAADPPASFTRPRIELPGIVEPGLADEARAVSLPSLGAATEIWEEVVRQVAGAGLALCTALNVPGAGDPDQIP